jgi:hypothetical protein
MGQGVARIERKRNPGRTWRLIATVRLGHPPHRISLPLNPGYRQSGLRLGLTALRQRGTKSQSRSQFG